MVVDLDNTSENRLLHARILSNLTSLERTRGKIDVGINEAKAGLDLLATLSDNDREVKFVRADILKELGTALFFGSEIEPAIENMNLAIEIFDELGEVLKLSNTYGNLALMYRNLGKYDTMIEYLNLNLKVCEEAGHKKGIANGCANLASSHHILGDFHKSLELNMRAHRIFEELGNIHYVLKLNGNIALNYIELGNFDNAIELLEGFKAGTAEIGDKRSLGVALVNLGGAYTEVGDFARARENLDEAINMFESINDKFHLVDVYNIYSELCLLESADWEKAEKYATDAVDFTVELKAKMEEGRSHKTLGMVYRHKGDNAKSLEEFEKAGVLLEKVGFKSELAKYIYEHGLSWKESGDIERAKERLETALSMFQKMDMKLWEKRCGKALAGL